MSTEESDTSRHFIRQIIEADVEAGKYGGKVVTRFPPEPNGYLHIGHAKSICLNFGMAERFNGKTTLRMDDTNPTTEDIEYVEAIKKDVKWLGFDWGEDLYHASDYYQNLYDFAIKLIKDGKAYACSIDQDEFNEKYRGTPTEPGTDSPDRERSVAENLELFQQMTDGKFAEGEYVLRAKIDMQSPNIHMRDPVIYRIRHAHHYRTGDKWKVYPMYDFAHSLSDYLEGITHSICTLEFEVHRPLYDWPLIELDLKDVPHQYEFARLNLTYTIMSKRKLQQLVQENHVNGWDDPRMPTISGLRRRGYSPEAIREFCDRIGVSKYNSMTDVSLLEFCIREDLNKRSQRRMAVLNPLKVIITNYPEGEEETFAAQNNPEDEADGTRQVPFSREIYIDRDDFMEDPPKKFYRLGPGREIRLRAACYITCTDYVKDDDGNVTEVHCTWDPESRGASTPDGRKVKGTIHWVSAKHAVDLTVNLYDRLFTKEDPEEDKDVPFTEHLNPESLEVIQAKGEASLADANLDTYYQFERVGYFKLDPDSSEDKIIFNRTIALRDSWAKKK